MSCRCPDIKPQPTRPYPMPDLPAPESKGVVEFCDLCDPCNECVSNVRICAFVVPTLGEGRYYKNAFVFVEEDNSVYYITDDRSEIPFGSRPLFIPNFEPSEHQFKSTLVFDVDNHAGYVYDEHGHVGAFALTETPILALKEGYGIIIEDNGAGEYTFSVDQTKFADYTEFKTVEEKVNEYGPRLDGLEGTLEKLQSDLASVKETADKALADVLKAQAAADSALSQAEQALTELAGKQDKLQAGDGISIEDNVISCTLDVKGNATTTENGLMSKEDRKTLVAGVDVLDKIEATFSGVGLLYDHRESNDDGTEYTLETKTLNIPVATDDSAGLLSPADKAQIAANTKAIADETVAREEEDTAIREEMQQKDTELEGKITTESETREQNDTELEGKITTETSERQTKDTELEGKITTNTQGIANNKASIDKLESEKLSIANLKATAPIAVTTDSSSATVGITMDDTVKDSTNPVQNKAIKTYVDEQIKTAVSSVFKYKGSVATEGDLPESDRTVGDVYNVEKTGDNYAWSGTEWDKLAGEIDLTDYTTSEELERAIQAAISDKATKVELTEGLAKKQDTLTAGTNITITENTISSKDTTYTAGEGLTLTGTTFSADMKKLVGKTEIADMETKTNAEATYAKKTDIPGIATTTKAGIVKPDGTTITVTEDGTITSPAQGLSDYATKTEISDMETKTHAAATYATKTEAATKTELAGYVKKTDYATSDSAGIVKPDGTTITISEDGTLTASAGAITIEEYTNEEWAGLGFKEITA